MKTIVTAALLGTAALSLSACSGSGSGDTAANTAALSLNEADIPAEGNLAGTAELDNDSLGFDNSLVADNALTPVDNAAGATNTL